MLERGLGGGNWGGCWGYPYTAANTLPLSIVSLECENWTTGKKENLEGFREAV